MTQATLQLLKNFLKNLNRDYCNRLLPFHAKLLKSLHHIKINYNLLHTVVSFWDPKDYVFRFNGQELYPFIEEFVAIFGCLLDLTVVIALPKIDMQFPN